MRLSHYFVTLVPEKSNEEPLYLGICSASHTVIMAIVCRSVERLGNDFCSCGYLISLPSKFELTSYDVVTRSISRSFHREPVISENGTW